MKTFSVTDEFYEQFSAWLKVELQTRGISSMDLVRKSGVSRAQVARILGDKSDGMTLKVLMKISRALGYHVEFKFEKKQSVQVV